MNQIPYDPEMHASQLGIRIIDACLPAGTLALWDETTKTILASPGLLHRQRRCVLAHELAHAVNGDTHALLDDVAARKRERRAEPDCCWLASGSCCGADGVGCVA
jgi:hypothetical protein